MLIDMSNPQNRRFMLQLVSRLLRGWKAEELVEAAEDWAEWLNLSYQIYERVRADPEAHARFQELLASSEYQEIKRVAARLKPVWRTGPERQDPAPSDHLPEE